METKGIEKEVIVLFAAIILTAVGISSLMRLFGVTF
jgi:hypothetical protein